MGSETVAATEPKSPSFSSRLARRRPMQMMTATVRRTPRSMPGKKPAMKPTGVILVLSEVGAAAAVWDAELADLLVVALGLLVEEADADADLDVAAACVLEDEAAATAFITHWPFVQPKPLGQQVLLPHVSKDPVKSVLCS